MSSIIPVNLLSFATNPSYLDTLVTTNTSNPDVISLLSYDDSFVNVIGENATARQLHNLDWQAFHEGGVYNKATNKIYITSNWAGSLDNVQNVTIVDLADTNYNITSTRYDRLSTPNGATSYYPPGTQHNGTNNTASHLLFCDQGDFNNHSALISVDPVTGESGPIINSYLGRNFSGINDARQHPETGEIWFTDTDYGFFQDFRPATDVPKHVYRFNPATGEIAVVADGFIQPNGLEFSPDLETLYVSDTGSQQSNRNPSLPATIYAYDIEDSRRLSNRRVFAYTDIGLPDGIHTDTEGNVWAACGDGVHIWNSEGKLLGKIWLGVDSNNLAFLPGAVLVFSNSQLWIVENLKAVGREICRDFGLC